MSRIKLLILLLFLASIPGIQGCWYSFALDKGGTIKKISLAPSLNRTSLREAGMILDSHLERTLSSMGMLTSKDSLHTLSCAIVSSSYQAITSPSLSSSDRYRLTLNVLVDLTDEKGEKVWNSLFTDEGTYVEGGQQEDALDEACREVSLQIARALASLSL